MDNKLENSQSFVAITTVMKDMLLASPFIALASVPGDGIPHLIVVGKVKEIKDDSHLVFGVYKMDVTRKKFISNRFPTSCCSFRKSRIPLYR